MQCRFLAHGDERRIVRIRILFSSDTAALSLSMRRMWRRQGESMEVHVGEEAAVGRLRDTPRITRTGAELEVSFIVIPK